MNAVAMRLVVDGTHNQHVIKHVLLHVIVPGERNAITLDALPTDDNKQTFLATIPKELLKEKTKSYTLQYYWQIIGNNNTTIAHLGTQNAPLSFEVLAYQPTVPSVGTEAAASGTNLTPYTLL